MLGRVSLLVVVLAASSMRPAEACLNPVRISTDEGVALASEVERLLADGDYERAVVRLRGEESDMRLGLGYGVRVERKEDFALQSKLELLAATAQIRTGRGGLMGVRDYLESRLEGLDGQHPVVIALVAELRATSADERDRASALAALRVLEQYDLMPDAASYGVLSRLQAGFHDEAGAARSMARCLATAHRAAQCAPPPPEPVVRPTAAQVAQRAAAAERRAARKRSR